MNLTLRALLSGIIDYAGLFPPARLDMHAAVRSYASYGASAHAWMLGRMIVPMSRLDEFESAIPALGDKGRDAWRLSAIAAPAGDMKGLEADLARIDRFNERRGRGSAFECVIDTVELRAETAAEIDAVLLLAPRDIELFVEIPVGGDARGMVAALAGSGAAAKVRTGGSSPAFFPAATDLARFIWSCAMAEVPFKATAGLHHPLPGPSRTVAGAREHGFLNVFAGAVLVRQGRIEEEELVDLLEDASWASFDFAKGRLEWRGRSASLEETGRARGDFARSYGSCSFEEPIEDLRSAGLLDQAARQR
jgi:hypothetical protein